MAQTAPTEGMTQEASTGPIYVDTQHEDLVHDAQLDYYGCKLATSSSDRTIKIYNVSEDASELSATLQGHEGPVWQVSWAHPKFGGKKNTTRIFLWTGIQSKFIANDYRINLFHST